MASRTISDSASELIPQNKHRVSWIIQNEDTTINIFVKMERGATVSSTDHDHRLAPGGTLALNNVLDGLENIQERWSIIAASGTPRISLFETENIER